MYIYLAASTSKLEQNKKRLEKIISVFEKLGHTLAESWVVDKIKGKKNSYTPNELLLRNQQLVQECDLVVVEMSVPSFGVGYQFGQALAHRKHVLCLYPDDMPEQKLSDIVRGLNSSLLDLKLYNLKNLEKIIRNYVAGINMDDLRKFNFIATDEIIRFIEDGARKEGKSKSEFLRDKITNEIIKK